MLVLILRSVAGSNVHDVPSIFERQVRHPGLRAQREPISRAKRLRAGPLGHIERTFLELRTRQWYVFLTHAIHRTRS